ncbi:MAG: hypothetical protein EPO68_02245 [Planctomycetota bacterium]|nr:MAG: hypothetical protein EPO68_02245 [Planctomycetota bacterium]
MLARHSRIALALLSPALATALAAQSNVIVVGPLGPGVDYANLFLAIQASTPGTIILVKSGGYGAFDTGGRAIHIVADSGATPHIGQGESKISFVPAGPSCSLRGLRFDATFPLDMANVLACAWVEDCHFAGGVQVDQCVSAGFARCTTSSTTAPLNDHPALHLSALPPNPCRVWSFDSEWSGGSGFGTGSAADTNGLSGSVSINASLYLSGGSTRGGDSAAWSSGTSCVQGAAGQGAYVSSGSVLRHLGASFVGGTPSTACGSPPIGGEPLVSFGSTVDALVGTPRSLVASSPVREGQIVRISVHGAPGELAFVAYAADFQPGLWSDEWRAPLLVGAPLRVVPLGILPASGAAQLAFTVGELGAGVEGARAVAQGAFLDPQTLAIQLGSASEFVLLDASL